MVLNSSVSEVINILEDAGFKVYIIGGAVRDNLLGIVPSDFDLATNAMVTQMYELFSNFKIAKTGEKFGTITIIINNLPIEITTFRMESNYKDNRHPKQIEFVDDVKIDLCRRDFTINAIAYNPKEGLIDKFGGIQDIKNKLIRSVGDPNTRFKEDGLRIIRALRFASVLGFTIEDTTREAIFDNKDLLRGISDERIFNELKKLICGKNVKKILTEYFDVFCVLMPDLSPMKNFNQHNPYHKWDILTHTAIAISNCPNDFITRLVMLFHDSGKPYVCTIDSAGIGHFHGHEEKSKEIAIKYLKMLKVNKHILKVVPALVKLHDLDIQNDRRKIRSLLNKYGEKFLSTLIDCQIADNKSKSKKAMKKVNDLKITKSIMFSIIKNKECISFSQLKIKGRDICNMGYKGQAVGQELQKCLNAVINEKVDNNKKSLIKYISETKE